jgi:hypothetical protein
MLGLSISLLKSIGKHPGCNDLDKSSPPPAPDYTRAAKETAAGNLEAAKYATEANRINQYTPYGNLIYSKNPTTSFDQAGFDKAMADYNKIGEGTGRAGFFSGSKIPAPDRAAFTKTNDNWSQTTSLAPEQQKLLDQQNATSLALGNTMNKGVGYVQGMLDKPFDTSQLPDMPTTADNAGRDAMTQALLDRQQPMFDRQKSQTEANLLARGFNPGGEAFNASADDLGRQQNDARLAAMAAGGAEQSRMFGLGTQARQNALQEQSFLRNEPLNTLNAVRTGAQVTGPQFNNVPMQQGVAGPDLLGAANATGQYNQGIYNANQAGQNATTSGLFGLGAAALMGSDIRLKRNIKRIGTHALGVGWYIFDYVWGERGIGVMAQELFHVKPDAVLVHPSGYLMVDYSRI